MSGSSKLSQSQWRLIYVVAMLCFAACVVTASTIAALWAQRYPELGVGAAWALTFLAAMRPMKPLADWILDRVYPITARPATGWTALDTNVGIRITDACNNIVYDNNRLGGP